MRPKTLIVSCVCLGILAGFASGARAADPAVPVVRQASNTPRNPGLSADPLTLQTRDLSTGLTLDSIIAALLGTSSIAISNVRFSGSDSALGIFTGGTGIIGFEQGIVMSSGLVSIVPGPNSQDGAGWGHFRPGDPDLDSLIPGFQTEDACILEFDFECPAVREIGFEYVFSSEEYNEYVYNSYNDVFGFFVNGKNIALLPDGVTVVSIDNVNGGNPLGDSATNPQYYINNDECQFSTVPSCPVNTEMDGLTVVLIARAKIQPGPNHIKLAIADAGDDILDSDVFLKGQSFVCGAVNNNAPTCAINPSGPFDVLTGSDVSFTVTGTDPDSGQTIYLYTAGNLPPGATMTPSLPLAGPRTGTSSEFSWVPTQAGTYFASFFVTDSLGGVDTATTQINVTEPQVNNPPTCVIDPAGPFNTLTGQNVNFTVTGTDPDDGQAIFLYALGNLPPGAAMTPSLPRAGSRTGLSSQFSWTPTQPGTYFARFFVTDSLGGADTCTAQINVSVPQANRPPLATLDPAGPFEVRVGTAVSFTVFGTDPDTGQLLTLSQFGTLPAGASMTPTLPANGPSGVSSQFSWTPAQPGTFLIGFLVADNFNAKDTVSTTITVRESTLPFVVSVAPPNDAPDVAWIVPVTVTFSESVYNFCDMLTAPIPCVSVLSNGPGALPVSLSWSGASLVIRPDDMWPDDDTITVVLSGRIRDLADNSLDGDRDGIAEGSPEDDYAFRFFTAPGVYPGDANDDGIVDERDVLPLGVHYLRTGQNRQRNPDIWTVESAFPWSPREATHADCDGNGIIDSLDICTILEFFDREIPAKRSPNAESVDLVASLDTPTRASLLNALLDCSGGTAAARDALIDALSVSLETAPPLPESFILRQNYPNPFNSGTVVSWDLALPAHVELSIFDVLGHSVRKLIDTDFPAGSHGAAWDGKDDQGHALASGVYIYRIVANGQSAARNMVLVR